MLTLRMWFGKDQSVHSISISTTSTLNISAGNLTHTQIRIMCYIIVPKNPSNHDLPSRASLWENGRKKRRSWVHEKELHIECVLPQISAWCFLRAWAWVMGMRRRLLRPVRVRVLHSWVSPSYELADEVMNIGGKLMGKNLGRNLEVGCAEVYWM